MISRIDVGGVGRSYGGSKYPSFVIGAGIVPGQETLFLLRRINLPGYPVDAFSLAPAT